MARDIYELASAIRDELSQLAVYDKEKDELIAQIDAISDDVAADADALGDWELMNKATTLVQKITHILNASSDESDEFNTLAKEVIKPEMLTNELDDNQQNRARLERILDKAKYSNAVAKTLRDTLTDILAEAKALKASRQHN